MQIREKEDTCMVFILCIWDNTWPRHNKILFNVWQRCGEFINGYNEAIQIAKWRIKDIYIIRGDKFFQYNEIG